MKPFKLQEKGNSINPLKIKAIKLFTDSLKENRSLYNVLLQLLTILKEETPDAKIYACGGIIRDTFLHIFQNQTFSFKDLDLVIEGINIEKLNHVLERLKGRCSLLEEILFVGVAFSVWKLKVKNYTDQIDLALTRTERSFGSHHKDFEISNEDVSIELDASRRDFTMNALYLEMHINPSGDIDGKLFDFHKGLDSIIALEIKCVGEPEERFREDPLRMLRAIRFRAKFPGFNIENRTSQAIYRLVPELLQTISKERMADELYKALVGNPEKALKDFRDYRIISQILPEIAELDESAYERISRRINYLLTKLGKEPDSPLIFSALLLDMSQRELANRMRRSLDRSKIGPWFFSLSSTSQIARQVGLPCVKKISHFCNDTILLSHFDFLENADAVIEEIISRCKEKEFLKGNSPNPRAYF